MMKKQIPSKPENEEYMAVPETLCYRPAGQKDALPVKTYSIKRVEFVRNLDIPGPGPIGAVAASMQGIKIEWAEGGVIIRTAKCPKDEFFIPLTAITCLRFSADETETPAEIIPS